LLSPRSAKWQRLPIKSWESTSRPTIRAPPFYLNAFSSSPQRSPAEIAEEIDDIRAIEGTFSTERFQLGAPRQLAGTRNYALYSPNPTHEIEYSLVALVGQSTFEELSGFIDALIARTRPESIARPVDLDLRKLTTVGYGTPEIDPIDMIIRVLDDRRYAAIRSRLDVMNAIIINSDPKALMALPA
jgi:hypothetical protein